MLLSEYVKLRWNPKIKSYYTNLGYKYTKMQDEFMVSVHDLMDSSCVLVDVKCDYCNKEYQKHWYRYLTENKEGFVHTDCCKECRKYKIQDVAQKKYGVNSVLCLDLIKEKIAKTNLKKYGVENPFASDEIKKKIIQTNLKKYGVASPMQNADILQKTSNTCMERYGVNYYIETQRFYGEENPLWKGGLSIGRNERCGAEYSTWRNSVFSRDMYTCQCCGIKNHVGLNSHVVLNAHHINNWNDYPDLRYDINNGITLCNQCHILFHSEFGKKFNTYNQLNEFFINHGKKIC